MVSELENIRADVVTAGEQLRFDALADIAHQQHTLIVGRDLQHQRRVIARKTARPSRRPQRRHAQVAEGRRRIAPRPFDDGHAATHRDIQQRAERRIAPSPGR